MRHDYIITGRALGDATLVGPKFARQAALIDHGLPVPGFFCLTAQCYRDLLRPHRAKLAARFARIDFTRADSLARGAHELREIVDRVALPSSIEQELLHQFDATFGRGSLVSVRSSMVGGRADETEDSAANPFAGMSDSFLYVPRAEVLAAIKRCWSSGFNAESILYRQRRGMDPFDFAVAVGVQRMLFGERSFVLFTCDPKSGARDPVIAAGYGIGEGVVQEKVAVDHYFVTRASGTIRSEITDKQERLGHDPAHAGTVTLPVIDELRFRPVLSEDEVRQLVALGDKVEALFGAPQDIEGTWTADGAVHLLQARPVAIDFSRQLLWSNANITESFPGNSAVLTYAFARQFYSAIFYDLYRRAGVDPSLLHRNAPALAGMIGFLDGRIYYCLTAWYQLHRQVPVFGLVRARWERMMGLTASPDAQTDDLRSWTARPVALARIARSAARLVSVALTHDRAMQDFERFWEALIGSRRNRDLGADDGLQLVHDFQAVWREVGEHWGVTLINDLLLTMTMGAAESLVVKWLGEGEKGLLSDLLCGGDENRSVEILMSTVRQAERVRAQPELLRALCEQPAQEVWPSIARGDFGQPLLREITTHLERYGDRGLEELKMEQPAARKTPWVVLRNVAEYARSDMTVSRLRATEREIRSRAEQRLLQLLGPKSPRRAALRFMTARLRRYILHRENSRYCRSELFGFARATFMALGQQLVKAGVLKDVSDTVHLTPEELFGYFDGTGTTLDLAGVAAVRRAEYERQRSELPMNFATLGPVRDALPQEPAESLQPSSATALRGLGSSGGKVRGTARVVLDPHAPIPTCDDMILIARETDPGWLFLMLSAKGIVVERGTMLSHTAITGRQFAIPTIVSLHGATSFIPDGAMIEMDGHSGVVTLLEVPHACAS